MYTVKKSNFTRPDWKCMGYKNFGHTMYTVRKSKYVAQKFLPYDVYCKKIKVHTINLKMCGTKIFVHLVEKLKLQFSKAANEYALK